MEHTQAQSEMSEAVTHLEDGYRLVYDMVKNCPDEARLFAALQRIMDYIRCNVEPDTDGVTVAMQHMTVEWVIGSWARAVDQHPDATWSVRHPALLRIMHAEGRRCIDTLRAELCGG